MTRGRPRTRGPGKLHAQMKTVDRKPIRPLERQRMRPWLIELLDNKLCNQLVWMNKREKMFRVNWKHAAGQTFDASADATLFEHWARHTGKYYTGDKPDPKRWKANFRCALNSLLDVDEDKAQGVRKGNNAFKVYRFLDEKKIKKQRSASVSSDKQKTFSESADDENEEFMVLKNLGGTRSRPKRCPKDELDSEGSEAGSSPYHDSNHSDWEMTTADLRESSTDELECAAHRSPQSSPLPNFDELCQTVSPAFQEALRRIQPAASSQPDPRDMEDESSDSSCGAPDELTDTEIMENVEFVTANACDFPTLFWNTVNEYDYSVQEAPEEVILSESGPNVIVIPQDYRAAEYVCYTSIADL